MMTKLIIFYHLPIKRHLLKLILRLLHPLDRFFFVPSTRFTSKNLFLIDKTAAFEIGGFFMPSLRIYYWYRDYWKEKSITFYSSLVNTTHMVAPSSANHPAPGSAAQMFPPSRVPQTPQIPSQSQIDAMVQDLDDMEEVSSSRQAGVSYLVISD